MVLHHIAQRAGFLVERPAALDAQRFGGGDLHVVDVIAVPDRLEDAVGKAEHQNVLHRLFAQVVVDAENLALLENGIDLVVELARRFQVVAKRLLNHHRRAPMLRRRHAMRAQVLNDLRKKLGRRGKVKKPVAADALFRIDAVQLGLESIVMSRVVEVQRKVTDVLDEFIEFRIVLTSHPQTR